MKASGKVPGRDTLKGGGVGGTCRVEGLREVPPALDRLKGCWWLEGEGVGMKASGGFHLHEQRHAEWGGGGGEWR